MTYAPQSSPARSALPACTALLLALAAGFPGSIDAQQRRPVSATTVHSEPRGVLLARLPDAATLAVGNTRSGWREVTLDGWVATSLLKTDRRNGFDLSVDGSDVRLRAAPNGAGIALMEKGMLLDRVEARGRWTHVRRTAWVRDAAVGPAPTATAAKTPAAADTGSASNGDTTTAAYRSMNQQPDAQADTAAPGTERMEIARATPLHAVPEGPELGTLAPGTPLEIVGRAGEWVRVRSEGWVRQSELKPATGGPLVGVTAAEVRANPERYVGQVVEWRGEGGSPRGGDGG